MDCKKCPHHVRHGQVAADGKSVEFKNRCGLRMKNNENIECKHYPFPTGFDYHECEVYQETFKSGTRKNDVVPSSDITEGLSSGGSLADMELL